MGVTMVAGLSCLPRAFPICRKIVSSTLDVLPLAMTGSNFGSSWLLIRSDSSIAASRRALAFAVYFVYFY